MTRRLCTFLSNRIIWNHENVNIHEKDVWFQTWVDVISSKDPCDNRCFFSWGTCEVVKFGGYRLTEVISLCWKYCNSSLKRIKCLYIFPRPLCQERLNHFSPIFPPHVPKSEVIKRFICATWVKKKKTEAAQTITQITNTI